MANKGQDIVSVIKKQMESFGTRVTMVDTGVVVEIGDGVARVHGLSSCRSMELLEFPNSVFGIALNLEEDSVGAVILGDERSIQEGDEVKTTGRIVEVPVGKDDSSNKIISENGQRKNFSFIVFYFQMKSIVNFTYITI